VVFTTPTLIYLDSINYFSILFLIPPLPSANSTTKANKRSRMYKNVSELLALTSQTKSEAQKTVQETTCLDDEGFFFHYKLLFYLCQCKNNIVF
jgi:hypothetical protein